MTSMGFFCSFWILSDQFVFVFSYFDWNLFRGLYHYTLKKSYQMNVSLTSGCMTWVTVLAADMRLCWCSRRIALVRHCVFIILYEILFIMNSKLIFDTFFLCTVSREIINDDNSSWCISHCAKNIHFKPEIDFNSLSHCILHRDPPFECFVHGMRLLTWQREIPLAFSCSTREQWMPRCRLYFNLQPTIR